MFNTYINFCNKKYNVLIQKILMFIITIKFIFIDIKVLFIDTLWLGNMENKVWFTICLHFVLFV